ncbi:MAG: hypothetical protein GY754_00595 [bacterium]|nr:hypothetical protein [bacterium]
MFTGSDIRKVTLALNKDKYNELLFELGTKECIHLSPVELSSDTDDISRNEILFEKKVTTLAGKLETLVSQPGTGDAEPGISPVIFRKEIEIVEKDELFVAGIKKKEDQYKRIRERISAELLKQKNRLLEQEKISSSDIDSIDINRIKNMKLCSALFGTLKDSISSISDSDKESLKTNNMYIEQSGSCVFAFAPLDKQDVLRALVDKYGFEDKLSLTQEKGREEKRIAVLEARLAQAEKSFANLKEEWKTDIQNLCRQYSLLKETLEARKLFLFSKQVLLVEGWIDVKRSGELSSLLKKICGGDFFLTISSRRETRLKYPNAPVILKNNRFFKPFELIVKNLGIPGNSEIDPTPIAGIAYIVLFGMMFGDVGQGLVLILTGLLLKYLAKKKPPKEVRKKNLFSQAGGLLVFAGLSAMVFGFLYGSIFSNEHQHLFHPLWFRPMEDMMKLFLAAIAMGACFIALGLVLHIINGFFTRDYEESLFGRQGLAGLILYCGMIFLFFRYTINGTPPAPFELGILLAAPVSVFMLRNILGFVLFSLLPAIFLRKKIPEEEKIFPHGLFEYIVESLVEIIEMFSGFLGNTISFIRAGAFALSHAGLGLAFYTLAGIIDPALTSVGAIAVIVVGNIFIIALEGLVCGIQSMRLEYYEFFGKFFKGDGVEFKPFSLRNE